MDGKLRCEQSNEQSNETLIGSTFTVLYVVLTFESADEIPWYYHSNEASSAVLSHDAIRFVHSSNF